MCCYGKEIETGKKPKNKKKKMKLKRQVKPKLPAENADI